MTPQALADVRTTTPRGVAAPAAVASLLEQADVRVGGDRPWDIVVHDADFFRRFPAEGSIGLGESYMDGAWDADAVDELVARLVRAELHRHARRDPRTVLHVLRSRLGNLQTRRRSRHVAERHYDLDADLYMSFLDPYDQYTCAYWDGEDDTLERAQERKLDLICRKLRLGRGTRVLDIGCGWGGFARFAAERFGAAVTGITISASQAAYARRAAAGLDVDIVATDYRDIPERLEHGSYDAVLVCGMIEHVGWRNYRALMESAAHALRERGLFLLHTIGRDESVTTITTHRWVEKYIFPNGMAPSLAQLFRAAERLFVTEDLHQFGARHYERTLMAWNERFGNAWPRLRHRYDERFRRMWRFYLLSCAGGFRANVGRLWQIVFSKGGWPEGYAAVR